MFGARNAFMTAGVGVVRGLFSWGQNSAGLLGLGNTTNYSSPKQVGALTTWESVCASSNSTAGSRFSGGRLSDGTIWSWGSGSSGQTGHGNTTDYSSPVQIGALTSWASISAGGANMSGLRTDGTAWTWGRGAEGQIGNGATNAYSSPKQVGTLTTWSGIYGAYSMVIGRIGTALWSWGQNNQGQLGLSNTTYYSSPVQIAGSWVSVVDNHGARVNAGGFKTGNALFLWGRNPYGQLGTGNTTNYSSPKQVSGSWAVASIAARHTMAIRTDGTLWTWGWSNNGQLGLGNLTNYSSPKQVGALTTWAAVSAGQQTSMAVKTDGTMWVWGQNFAGQLGLGNTTYAYSSPVQLGTKTNWSTSSIKIAMAYKNAHAIRV